MPSRIALPLGERQPDSWVKGWVRQDPWREDVNKQLPVAGPLTKHRPKTQIVRVVITTAVIATGAVREKKEKQDPEECV